ncbi:MAG: hypothetical protein OXL68_07415 [Paracoccaceae bacterium]|nr:hypothetical protein [Paracoccaceae bacterium]
MIDAPRPRVRPYDRRCVSLSLAVASELRRDRLGGPDTATPAPGIELTDRSEVLWLG